MSSSVIIIPARYESSRFPGKPLVSILGKTMLERVWRIAQKAIENDTQKKIYIATEDERIVKAAENFKAMAILTSSQCQNGTERVYEVVKNLKLQPDIIINLQGDAVLTPPHFITELISAMEKNPTWEMATLGTAFNSEKWQAYVQRKKEGNNTGTLVLCDQKGKALYFSKGIIPHIRENKTGENFVPPVMKHIGIYAYRFSMLKKYLELSPTPLEQVEKLEQLRVLEHGYPIHVVKVDDGGRTLWSVDNPQDIQIVEDLLKKEGELC
ncbi:MAG: 3-deoxy-manno-octulosonate cytidylyltransferase [Bacteriovoracaceae bacterium]|nr:3-deoxy-manno-octulosonate cytidylyltransferase [Bacteriovoracaceae bacterium]